MSTYTQDSVAKHSLRMCSVETRLQSLQGKACNEGGSFGTLAWSAEATVLRSDMYWWSFRPIWMMSQEKAFVQQYDFA